jgi:LPXTG-motif cell wall-anchored protein
LSIAHSNKTPVTSGSSSKGLYIGLGAAALLAFFFFAARRKRENEAEKLAEEPVEQTV